MAECCHALSTLLSKIAVHDGPLRCVCIYTDTQDICFVEICFITIICQLMHAIIDEIVYILLIFLDPSEKPLVPTSRNSQRKHSSKNSLYHSTFSRSCVFKQLPFIIVVESSLSLQVCERCLSSIAHTLLDFGNNYTIRSLRCVYSLALLVCPNISLLLTFFSPVMFGYYISHLLLVCLFRSSHLIYRCSSNGRQRTESVRCFVRIGVLWLQVPYCQSDKCTRS